MSEANTHQERLVGVDGTNEWQADRITTPFIEVEGHENAVQQVIDRAQAAYEGSIDLIARADAHRVVHHQSRFGRLKSIEGVVDKDEYDSFRRSLMDILSSVATKSYEIGLNDGIKEQGE